MESGKSGNNKVAGEVSKENLDVAIVDALLKEQRVVIPDLGYLELKSLSDRSTVLFKATNQQNSLTPQSFDETQLEGRESIIYNEISIPLKEGNVVSFPGLGIFRSIKQSDGNFRVSFTISSSLRKQLNGVVEKEPEKVIVSEKVEELSTFDIQEEKIISSSSVNLKELDLDDKKPKIEPEVNVSSKPIVIEEEKEDDDDTIAFQDEIEVFKKRKGFWRIFVLVVVCITVFIILLFSFQNKKENPSVPSGNDNPPSQSLNLLTLAEQHYGNSVFWVYIYEANRNKLASPVNIPKGVTLTIPDLSQPEYNVDVKDSLEIQRAKIKSENILKQQ